MENQHRVISGYRELDEAELETMNAVKALEASTAALWRSLADESGADPQCLVQARARLTEGFMWLTRSVAQPVDPFESGKVT